MQGARLSIRSFPKMHISFFLLRLVFQNHVSLPQYFSAITTCEEIFRASLEGIGSRHGESEGIGQPTDHVERETDRERILDLLVRSASSEDTLRRGTASSDTKGYRSQEGE